MRLVLFAVLVALVSPVASADKPAPPTRSASADKPAPVSKPAATPDAREATRKAAHDALATNCGQCHEGHRSTNAKALAIYDLDKPDWPSRFDDERRAQSALRRLSSKPDAKAAFLAFRDAERAAAAKPD
jgi:hypothetical protein